MKPVEYYEGNEQTFIKHYFLEKYLGRVLYNVLSFTNEFVYVDGFSGPWKSKDEKLGDTSFAIAVSQLEKFRGIFAKKGRTIKFRCLFNEMERGPYKELQEFCREERAIETRPSNRDFESFVPEIVDYIGDAFSLTFIDPSGWTGFGLQKIAPLLRLRGEVIINFMYYSVNRFWEEPSADLRRSLDSLYGGPGWEEEIQKMLAAGITREASIMKVYAERIKSQTGVQYVIYSPIVNPVSDRSFFYLVYLTRSPKGLIEFRNIEEDVFHLQSDVQAVTKRERRSARTGQGDLWAQHDHVEEEREREREKKRIENLGFVQQRFEELLREKGDVEYWKLLAKLLEEPLVFESDIQRMLLKLHRDGHIVCPRIDNGGRKFKRGDLIRWTT